MRLSKRCQMPDSPCDNITVAMQISFTSRRRAENPGNVARHRGLLGQHGNIYTTQITSVMFKSPESI